MKSFLFILLISISFLTAPAKSESITEEDTETTEVKAKPTPISKSHIEFMGASANAATGASISWVFTPQILVGIQGQRLSTMTSNSGGDLDAGQYYYTTSGFTGTTAMLTVKYFFNSKGMQVHGLFSSAQVGRLWGKYEYSQDRYERENGFLGNLFGVDKKLAESSADQLQKDSNILRAGLGYILPFSDGNLLKGVSLQGLVGVEKNTVPSSQFLSTKFGTKDVGEDIRPMLFTEIGIAAYF